MSSNPDIKEHDERSTPKSRGKRVESLRRMTRTSRRAFAEKYGIPKTSIQNWEDAFAGGLTEKGAKRLIAALKLAGITCTPEWLMQGIGQGPQISEQLFLDDVSQPIEAGLLPLGSDADEMDKMTRELALFHQHYPRIGMDYVVMDDGMEPKFTKGDQVAGCKRFGKKMVDFVGLDCIVQTTDGETLLRNIRKIDEKGHYTLACINPNTTIDKPILYGIELVSAAPVVWIRRKNPNS